MQQGKLLTSTRREHLITSIPVLFIALLFLLASRPLAASDEPDVEDSWAEIASGIAFLAKGDSRSAAEQFRNSGSFSHGKIGAVLGHLAEAYYEYFKFLPAKATPGKRLDKTKASKRAHTHLGRALEATRSGGSGQSEYRSTMQLVASEASTFQQMPPLLRVLQCHLHQLGGLPIASNKEQSAAMPNHQEEASSVRIPTRIFEPNAPYTAAARRARSQGVVILQATITAEGCVSNPTVVRGMPHRLDQTAVDGARWWVFEPATRSGRELSVNFNITMNFRLH